MDVTNNVFRISALHQPRGVARPASREQMVVERLHERREKLTRRLDVLQEVIAERDQLREHLENIRDLANRVITQADARHDRVRELERAVRAKDALIADLELENEGLIRQLSAREDRISMLEKFLRMIAEADERTR